MSEEKLDRIEDMLSTLILKVGNVLTEQSEMRRDIKEMKEKQESMEKEFNSLKGEFTSFKDEANTRHQEVMTKLTEMQADQDHIWDKTVKNERDLGIMKNLSKL